MNIINAFMELDKLAESYISREELIANLKAMGKNYNFDRHSTGSLYNIWKKAVEAEETRKSVPDTKPVIKRATCDFCGATLTDGGFCPLCDDGVEDYEESLTNLKEDLSEDFLNIEGFNTTILDVFEDCGVTGYNVLYSKDGLDIVSAEIWETSDPVTVIDNYYAPNLMQRTYESFTEFAEDLAYKYNTYITESAGKSRQKKAHYMCDNCKFEVDLSEEEYDGSCPRCHDHHGAFGKCEEALKESVPDNWTNYKGAWIYPIKNGFEANLDGLHYEAESEEELKAIIDDAIKNGFTKDKKLSKYIEPKRISHRAIWEDVELFENWADDRLSELLKKPKDTWSVEDWEDYYYCLNANAERDYFDALDEAVGLRDTEISTESAVISVVDQVKILYEAGLFTKLPVGRENAFTLDIYGPDKERLVGYFKKKPEFNYEFHNDVGIISHEFISHEYDIEIFDEFVSMYKIPQNESLHEGPFANKWVTSSGDKYSWNGNQATAAQQPSPPQQQPTIPTKSYIITNVDAATVNSDFYSIESDGEWYGEVATPASALRAPYSYYSFLNDAVIAAERIIKQVNLSYLHIYIYEYDSKNNTVTKIKEVDPNVILGKSTSNKKGYLVEIVVDPSSGRLRARADDGINGPAYVAFPNSLRVPGAKYYAEKLIWNGKNYRASGAIIPG